MQQLLKARGITDGAAYHRVNHLIHCGWYEGSIQEMRQMLATNDGRLVQLEAGQRQLLKRLIEGKN